MEHKTTFEDDFFKSNNISETGKLEKSKKVWVSPTGKTKGYYRTDNRTKKEAGDEVKKYTSAILETKVFKEARGTADKNKKIAERLAERISSLPEKTYDKVINLLKRSWHPQDALSIAQALSKKGLTPEKGNERGVGGFSHIGTNLQGEVNKWNKESNDKITRSQFLEIKKNLESKWSKTHNVTTKDIKDEIMASGSKDTYTHADTKETVTGEAAKLNHEIDKLFSQKKDMIEKNKKDMVGAYKLGEKEFSNLLKKKEAEFSAHEGKIMDAHKKLWEINNKGK